MAQRTGSREAAVRHPPLCRRALRSRQTVLHRVTPASQFMNVPDRRLRVVRFSHRHQFRVPLVAARVTTHPERFPFRALSWRSIFPCLMSLLRGCLIFARSTRSVLVVHHMHGQSSPSFGVCQRQAPERAERTTLRCFISVIASMHPDTQPDVRSSWFPDRSGTDPDRISHQ